MWRRQVPYKAVFKTAALYEVEGRRAPPLLQWITMEVPEQVLRDADHLALAARLLENLPWTGGRPLPLAPPVNLHRVCPMAAHRGTAGRALRLAPQRLRRVRRPYEVFYEVVFLVAASTRAPDADFAHAAPRAADAKARSCRADQGSARAQGCQHASPPCREASARASAPKAVGRPTLAEQRDGMGTTQKCAYANSVGAERIPPSVDQLRCVETKGRLGADLRHPRRNGICISLIVRSNKVFAPHQPPRLPSRSRTSRRARPCPRSRPQSHAATGLPARLDKAATTVNDAPLLVSQLLSRASQRSFRGHWCRQTHRAPPSAPAASSDPLAVVIEAAVDNRRLLHARPFGTSP